MKLKLFSIFISLIFILPIPLILIPSNVSATETEYLNVDFESGTYSPFVVNAVGSTFTVRIDGTGNHYLEDSKTANGVNSLYTNLVSWTPNSYEVSFDFKIINVVSTYYLFGIANSTSTPKSITQAPNFHVSVTANGSLYIDGIWTNNVVNDGAWHNLFINITNGASARISLDGNTPWQGYYNFATAYPHVYYPMFGSFSSSSNAVCYWDNITIASRIGSLPSASFDYTPNKGDGLTNFLFTDTSTFDNTIYPISYNWTFGDGNYTLTKNANHTYIHAGTYQVILEVSNRFGSSYAYTNITVSAINIGGEEITDDMFGFIIVILLITGLNILGTKTGYLMLSIFAILGMIIAIPMLWQNDPVYIALMLVMTLGNIALLIYGLTKE